VFFTSIRKSEHYKKFHEADVSWSEVIATILKSAKQMRKKGNMYELETDRHYILCDLKGTELLVINAKHK
jgi:hypothetical protein